MSWTEQRERSNAPMLRLMGWIASRLGRPVARAVLHPVALYFLLCGGAAARASAQYLARALGRPPRWRERYAHLHCFAATVLDRVYLLQGRFEDFDIRLTGAEAFDEALAAGEGVLLLGAHVGSFEALRALGQGRRGLKVAMVMYEDNARLINRALQALAPGAELHIIGLGRLQAMLELRQWLAGGGVAGLLADRSLPTTGGRERVHHLRFLGTPARFSDGPFRLAAMLRQRVVFMAGLYRGGKRYELRFLPLADFSQKPADAAALEAAVQAALARYVAIVEALCREVPLNWFNFYDFWAAGPAVVPEPAGAAV
jgi:predicted LPLAT superfamily acyltransferase